MTTKIITVEATPPAESTGADYYKGAPLNAAEFDQNIVNLRAAVDRKASLNNPTFTGTVSLPSTTSIGDVSATELQYLNSVTSNVQDQINAKAPINNPTFTGTASLSTGTANGVLYLNGSKQVISGSGLVFDGTNFGIGTSSPNYKLTLGGQTGAKASPIALRFADDYSSTETAAGCKVFLYNDGSTGNKFGFGVGESADVQYHAGSTGGVSTGNHRWYTNDTERMRLDSSGNLGIGTSSPLGRLDIVVDTGGTVASTTTLNISSGSSYGLNTANKNLRLDFLGYRDGVGANGVKARIQAIEQTGTTREGFLQFFTMDSSGALDERMRIDASGNLLVGVTSYGSPSNNSVSISAYDGRVWSSHASGTASGSSYEAFSYAGTVIGSITQNGTTGVSYNTASDYRLKEDYQPVADAITRLNQLKPINFAWKVDGSRCDGFLAHELQEVIPEAATGHKDETKVEEYEVTPAIKDEEGNVIAEAVIGEREVPVYQGIDQSKIVPLLTAALQEAVAKIESLTQRIEALEYTKQGE